MKSIADVLNSIPSLSESNGVPSLYSSEMLIVFSAAAVSSAGIVIFSGMFSIVVMFSTTVVFVTIVSVTFAAVVVFSVVIFSNMANPVIEVIALLPSAALSSIRYLALPFSR